MWSLASIISTVGIMGGAFTLKARTAVHAVNTLNTVCLGMDGLETIRIIQRGSPGCNIVTVTQNDATALVNDPAASTQTAS
jgi:hypothetical protein